MYHGNIVIEDVGAAVEHRWGGVSCGNKTLSQHLVVLLRGALNKGTLVTPRWVNGQGDAKCLTGFVISAVD